MIQSHYINVPPCFKSNVNFQRQNILWTKSYDEEGENKHERIINEMTQEKNY